MQQIKACFLLLFTLSAFCLPAQNINYLEKKVSLNKVNAPLSEILKDISTQTGVVFSYNSAHLNDQQKVAISVQKKTLRLVLDQLLKKSKCTYKQRKNYILITYNPKQTETDVPIVLSGYLYNNTDSTVIKGASIYISSGRHSAISDEFGYFSLTYPRQQNLISLSVAKENFLDTTLILLNPTAEKLQVFLQPLPIDVPVQDVPITITDPLPQRQQDSLAAPDSAQKHFLDFWLRLKEMRANFNNINDTFFSNYSVSLFPPLSTNKLLAVNTKNKISFNILAGTSKGVEYFELGGLINIDNGDVSYAQIGGLGNVVSGNVYGVQVGGLFNTVRKEVKGVQVGGVFNNASKFKGMQIGGIFNNVKKDVQGFQLAGIYNKAGKIEGMQLSGIYNKSGNISGVQLSGIYNRCGTVKGMQIGLINSADTLKGIPIGLFSFVKSGYHKLDISGNELGFLTIGFRSGVDHFHNFFFAGVNTDFNRKLLTFGYGIGSTLHLKGRWNITSELSSQHLQSYENIEMRLSLQNKFFTGIDFICSRHLRISVGPSFNLLFAEINNMETYTAVSYLVSKFSFYTETKNSIRTNGWIGGTVSIKLF